MRSKTFSEIFYESKKSKETWETHGDSMKLSVKNKLIQLKHLLTSPDLDDEYREKQWMALRRLDYGYNLFVFNGTQIQDSGLCTKKCLTYVKNRKKGKLVKDHFFGVTEASVVLRDEFEKCNFDIEYMLNEWLPKNYHLYLTWYVTPEEHKGKNITRAGHSIEEKDNFEHCNDKVSTIVEMIKI